MIRRPALWLQRAALGAAATVALASPDVARAQVPSVDIEQTCRLGASVMIGLMGGSDSENDFRICLGSEQKAREQLGKDWGTYPAADKTQCLQTNVYLPSYIEWLTCLEMRRDVTKLKKDQSAATKEVGPAETGVVTLPMVPLGINDGYPPQGSGGPITLPTVPLGINDGYPAQGVSATPITLPVVPRHPLY
jgi:hypothetical protein